MVALLGFSSNRDFGPPSPLPRPPLMISAKGWPQHTRGSRRSRFASAQGRYVNPRGYAPLESTAMVAFGNQCEPFSIVPPTRANSEGRL